MYNLDRFSMTNTLRTAKRGFYSGLAFGLVQDALGLIRGRRLRYIDHVKEMLGYKSEPGDEGKT